MCFLVFKKTTVKTKYMQSIYFLRTKNIKINFHIVSLLENIDFIKNY